MILEKISYETGYDALRFEGIHRIDVWGFKTKAKRAKQHIQLHISLREPISKENLAKAFELLAAEIREKF